MPKWRWSRGEIGRKMVLTLSGYGLHANAVWYDTRGVVSIIYFHRGQEVDTHLARKQLNNLFREYGRRIVSIDQMANVYDTQVYFKCPAQPSEEKCREWMGKINSVMSDC